MSEPYQDLNQVYYSYYYQFPTRSRWMEQIWAEAFGDNYPQGLEHYGYLTRHDLQAISEKLELQPGATLLDVGCGKGGPGLSIAQSLELRLIGVDVIPEAVDQAEQFSERFALAYPAIFEVGTFEEIPLDDATVDAAICIDSLWAAHDKVVALKEIRRVLKPGGKCVFTYWDLHTIEAIPYFEMAGLRFISREETPNWKEYQHRVYEGILAHEQELIAEMGAGANMLLYEAKASPAYLDLSVRRIYEMVAV